MTNTELLNAIGRALNVDVPHEEPTDADVLAVLDRVLEDRRGPAKSAPSEPPKLTNNLVLKKLRIALELKEPAVLAALEAGGVSLSSRELTPLFRKPGSKHFRACSDRILSAFLGGLNPSA